MRIVVLGAGGMGLYAAQTAASFNFVRSVLVADLCAAAAEKTARKLGRKGRSTSLDVLNHEKLDSVLANADFVLNTTGPFFELGTASLEGAIRNGVHYADICDDWEPTLEMLTLSKQASDRDVLAIIGIGASPGITNLLSVLAVAKLDTTETLLTGWPIQSDDDKSDSTPPGKHEPSAAMVHWMQQVSGTIRVMKDGLFTDVSPLDSFRIDYPGIGSFPVWTMGHPEAVTLPLKYGDLAHSANVMTGPSDAFNALKGVAARINSGDSSLSEAGQHIEAYGLPKTGEPGPRLGVFAWAAGKKGGTPAIAASTTRSLPPGGMGGATGIPLGVVLKLYHEGSLTARGVHAPETCINPTKYFDALAPFCAGDMTSADDLVWTSTTYD